MTEKGQKAYDKLQPMLEKIDRTAQKGISDEELEIFYRVLDKMRVNLENYSHFPDEKRKEIKSNNE